MVSVSPGGRFGPLVRWSSGQLRTMQPTLSRLSRSSDRSAFYWTDESTARGVHAVSHARQCILTPRAYLNISIPIMRMRAYVRVKFVWCAATREHVYVGYI